MCDLHRSVTSDTLPGFQDLPVPLQTQQQPPETFDWAHQWYSIGSAEDMDPSRPHAITLLGRDLVLWRDQQGDWRAFEDICPHRLAPLSGGARSAATTQPQRSLIWCSYAYMSPETIGRGLHRCSQQHACAREYWRHMLHTVADCFANVQCGAMQRDASRRTGP